MDKPQIGKWYRWLGDSGPFLYYGKLYKLRTINIEGRVSFFYPGRHKTKLYKFQFNSMSWQFDDRFKLITDFT